MEFKSKFAAWRALVLSDILSQIHPTKNQIFCPNGDIRIMGVFVRLNPSGKVVLLEKRQKQHADIEIRIPSTADMFEARGDRWNAINAQYTAHSRIHIITDPDGTRRLPEVEKPAIEGFDGWDEPHVIPERIADPVVAPDRNKALLRARMNANLAVIHAARGGLVRVKG